MSRLTHARTVVYNVNYHIVFSTKYRRAVLTDGVDETLKRLFLEIAKDKGFSIGEMEVMPDHVHLFVSAHPKFSPSYLYKSLKGISARRLFMAHPSLKRQLGGHLWNPSTYVETIGHISEETVRRYIEDQKKR